MNWIDKFSTHKSSSELFFLKKFSWYVKWRISRENKSFYDAKENFEPFPSWRNFEETWSRFWSFLRSISSWQDMKIQRLLTRNLSLHNLMLTLKQTFLCNFQHFKTCSYIPKVLHTFPIYPGRLSCWKTSFYFLNKFLFRFFAAIKFKWKIKINANDKRFILNWESRRDAINFIFKLHQITRKESMQRYMNVYAKQNRLFSFVPSYC